MRFIIPATALLLLGAEAMPHLKRTGPSRGTGVVVANAPGPTAGLPPPTPTDHNRVPDTHEPELPDHGYESEPEEPETEDPDEDEHQDPGNGVNGDNTCTTGELYCCTGDSLLSLSCLLPGLLAPACGQQVCCINTGSGDQTCTTTSGLNINVPITIGDIDIL